VNRSVRFAIFAAFLVWLAYNSAVHNIRRPAERPAKQQRAEPRPRVSPATLTGKVVSIADGDTLQIEAGEQLTIRLEGIDTPERGQPFGNQARRHLSDLTYGKIATVAVSGEDQFGRSLGIVTVDGQDINAAMVRDGFAWRYLYSSDKELARLEAEARRERRGLWQDRDPTPPWDYRRENPRMER
jgi:endonuclease YncB( thermonuclease family)